MRPDRHYIRFIVPPRLALSSMVGVYSLLLNWLFGVKEE